MNGVELPAFRVIDAALRETTSRLVLELRDPQDRAPEWNEFEWGVARAVCAMQGIAGLLATRLRWQGPPAFDDFLAHQRREIEERNLRIGTLLAKLDVTFREGGLPFVALKGSALRDLQLHGLGERPQSDIDLLIDPARRAECRALLSSLGYEQQFSIRRHDVYQPAHSVAAPDLGDHADSPLKIEVHFVVAETLPVESVDITASLFRLPLAPGANPYADRSALMRHLCLHAAGNLRFRAARFIQIYDIALLARRMTHSDWRALLGTRESRKQSWWMFPALVLAERHSPGSVPGTVLSRLRTLCPRRLRNRYERADFHDVSWSNLRIELLPGHEWLRTLGDVQRFLRSRVNPPRVELDESELVKAAQPHLKQVRWFVATRMERVVRWLFLRPPRVQTISAVTSALRGNP